MGLEAPAVKSKDLNLMCRPQVEAEKDSHKLPLTHTGTVAHVLAHKMNT